MPKNTPKRLCLEILYPEKLHPERLHPKGQQLERHYPEGYFKFERHYTEDTSLNRFVLNWKEMNKSVQKRLGIVFGLLSGNLFVVLVNTVNAAISFVLQCYKNIILLPERRCKKIFRN